MAVKVDEYGRILDPTDEEKRMGALYVGTADNALAACYAKCEFHGKDSEVLCGDCYSRVGWTGYYLKEKTL